MNEFRLYIFGRFNTERCSVLTASYRVVQDFNVVYAIIVHDNLFKVGVCQTSLLCNYYPHLVLNKYCVEGHFKTVNILFLTKFSYTKFNIHFKIY